MNSDLSDIHGFCIAKQIDLRVFMGSYLNFNLHGYVLIFKFAKLLTLDRYDEGELIDQPLIYKQNQKLKHNWNNNGFYDHDRKNINFSGNFHYDQPIGNTQGVLIYDNHFSNLKCIETGTFNEFLKLSGYGSRKEGNHHVIGKFIDGNIKNHFILQNAID